MKRPPRGLSAEDAELWRRVARTVKPLNPPLQGRGTTEGGGGPQASSSAPAASRSQRVPLHHASHGPPPRRGEDLAPARPRPLDRHGLDGSWEKKLARAGVHPDFTLDLHGHSLEAAHSRLDHGLAQAVAMGARVVLVITGRPRPTEAADRGERRGAIRAKLIDWLAAGPHAHRIAAVRAAHRKHGGAGAVYVVIKKPR